MDTMATIQAGTPLRPVPEIRRLIFTLAPRVASLVTVGGLGARVVEALAKEKGI